ncbi:MAG: hypothetical protein M3081_15510 [Gemmatimonadota bacterium]|nr:hypothetical protein [Gemmatimonadota bacterium]
MDFLVLLEEQPEQSLVLARVDSVPAMFASERRARDVVTLYGIPSPESLALALAAAVESHRTGDGAGSFRHLGVWPERGAVGDTAWRDDVTGELMTSDLDIPFDVLSATATQLLSESGAQLRRLVAGLAMPDWPEGAWRAITMTIDSIATPARDALYRLDGFLESVREADGLTYEYEGD